MDGLARPAGSGVPITFQGETLILEPLTLRDLGVVENKLLQQRPSPLDLVKPHLAEIAAISPELAEKLLKEAYQDARKGNKVPVEEVTAWMETLDGISFTLWLALEKRYPGRFTPEKILDLMTTMPQDDVEAVKRARDMAAGVDALGNSTGPSPTTETPAANPSTV